MIRYARVEETKVGISAVKIEHKRWILVDHNNKST